MANQPVDQLGCGVDAAALDAAAFDDAALDAALNAAALEASIAVGRCLANKGLEGVLPIGDLLAKIPTLRDVAEFLACDETPKLVIASEATSCALLGSAHGKACLWIAYAPQLEREQLQSLLADSEVHVGNCHWPSLWERHVETDFGVAGNMFFVLGPTPVAAHVLVLGYVGRTHCGFCPVALDDLLLTDYQANYSACGVNYRPTRMYSEAELEASVPRADEFRPPEPLIAGAKWLLPYWQK